MTRCSLIKRARAMLLLLALIASQGGYGQSHSIALGQAASTPQEPPKRMVEWQDYAPVLRELSESVSTLKTKLGNKNQQLNALFDRMKTHSDFLSDQWNGACCETTPATYLESLEQDAALLKSVLDNQTHEKEISAVLKVVEEDLRIKAAHCKLSPKGWDALVVVSVNAKKGKEKVDGLEVWFVQKGWLKTQSKWKRFAKVTCGTSETFPPGIYMIWLKGFEPVPIEIGGNGVGTKEVELVVP